MVSAYQAISITNTCMDKLWLCFVTECFGNYNNVVSEMDTFTLIIRHAELP